MTTQTAPIPAASTHVVDGLAHLLADTYTLYLKTHGYHWNVSGPHFPALHLLFEDQYTELREAVDEIAERIRALRSADSWLVPAARAADGHRRGRERPGCIEDGAQAGRRP